MKRLVQNLKKCFNYDEIFSKEISKEDIEFLKKVDSEEIAFLFLIDKISYKMHSKKEGVK